ncbi:hypothetical protein DFH09DRAFT_1318180 [Mycena vulgaris]|nr:hypothetical protein DFH09DRAFT_1318180 [Mycena vulgaris]
MDPTKHRFLCEAAIALETALSMVVLRLISKEVHPDEAYVFEYFSSLELASDPWNHCIPLPVKLSPPDDEYRLIFVMKLMRPHDSPRFDTFGDVVELFR